MQSYNMGNKSEMLVAVRAPEGKQGPIEVSLTTDLAADAFLHWGVRKGASSDWGAPPKEIWPEESTPVEGNAAAVDTPFLEAPGDYHITVRPHLHALAVHFMQKSPLCQGSSN